MTPRPSPAPQCVPLQSPPASSLPLGPHPESDFLCATSPAVTRFLAIAVTDPLFESTAAFALVTELVDFSAACRLDYATSLVAKSAPLSVCPPSVGGECALGTDIFECFFAASPHLVSMLLAPEGDPDAPDIPTPRSYAEAIEGPFSSQWQAAMDAEMDSWKSTGTYVNQPPGSLPFSKARYIARGFSQRQGVDFFQTFSPTPKMTTLRVLLHVAAQHDYELHSLDFSSAFLQGSLHEEIWLRRLLGFTGSTLAALGFAPSTSDPSRFLRTDNTLPPFYVLVYVDGLVFATADTEVLAHVKSELHKKHTFTNLVQWAWGSCLEDRLELSSVVTLMPPGSSCEAEIYAGAMAAQELRWLTYVLIDLGEAPRSPPVAASSQVFATASGSGPESAPCSCRLLSHQTLLWHHRLGHPSLPRLRGMASRVLVSGLPRSLPSLPPGPAPTCVPCAEGRQRAAPHSSFPPTEAPLQTLHMDVWGPARVRCQGHERYFLLVVDDYSHYTTVFPLRSKGEVTEVLINWIRAARLWLRESFGSDFPVLRLHCDRGGEFSSARLGAFCRALGIRQTFTLPASPQKNGIAERRIGMVMDVARTSMIHAAAPHFLWPFAVQYAAHQLNLQPRVSLPKTPPTVLWTGKVGDASAFWVWGSRAFVRDLSADKLSPRATPCVFLGFPLDAPGWQFYHPTLRHVLSSLDVTFDESVPYYRLFPYRTAPLPPPPLFLAPGRPPVDPLPPQGPAPSGVSQVDAVEPVEVAGDSGAAKGAEPAGAGSGGTEPEGAEPGGLESGGAESEGTEPGGAESEGAELGRTDPGGAEPGGAGSARVASRGATSRRKLLSPQQLREWFARRWSRASGAAGPGGAAEATGVGGSTGAAGSGGTCPGGAGAAGPGGPTEATGVGSPGGSSGASGGTGAAGSPGTGAAGVVPKYYSGTVIALPFNLQACSASGILWGGA
ncbi:unnamed protein product [Closterium sp. NIES-53]